MEVTVNGRAGAIVLSHAEVEDVYDFDSVTTRYRIMVVKAVHISETNLNHRVVTDTAAQVCQHYKLTIIVMLSSSLLLSLSHC